jgi:alpha-D-xyloside xylohydrolase
MPYIFGRAVESHETGVPVMRPMMLEFPEDVTCQMLDRQYMLGDSLLVAPVFHGDGHVDCYLPEGEWTSLLSGEVTEGGKWRRENHGFMSLPLYVRENTVLPMGSVDNKPDYDYADNVTLHLFSIKDGASVTAVIPDLGGKPAATFTVKRSGCDYTVETDSGKPYFVAVHGVQNIVCKTSQVKKDETGVPAIKGNGPLRFSGI